jgi:hypothetical protein
MLTVMEPDGRRSLPPEPVLRASPTKMASFSLYRHMLPSVWPGVWITVRSSILLESFRSRSGFMG